MTNFKAGDRVRRIEPGHNVNIGDEFVLEVAPNGELSPSGSHLGFAYPGRWELVEEPAQTFEVGDKIRINDVSKIAFGSSYHNQGDITTVTRIDSDGDLRVKTTKSGSPLTFLITKDEFGGIEKVSKNEEAVRVNNEMQVGDLATVLNAEVSTMGGFHAGDTVEITVNPFGKDDEDYHIRKVGAGTAGYAPKLGGFLRKKEVAVAPPQKFQVGDKVRITNLSNVLWAEQHFNEGDVTEVNKTEGPNRIRVKSAKGGAERTGGDSLWVVDDEIASLSHVDAAEESSEDVLEAKIAEMDALAKRTSELAREIAQIKASKPRGRVAVIQKACKDVEELTEKMRSSKDNYEGNYTFRSLRTVPEFHVNREKGVVTALVQGANYRHLYEKGFARCSAEDTFNEEIGKALALRRALGLPEPKEYLNAPQY